jgi:hypothetical protein
MLRNRLLIAVLALVAAPFVAAAAQGNSQDHCKNTPAARTAQNGRATGTATAPGQVKKCEQAPPPVEQPPTGIHYTSGYVYDDADGNGSWDPYSGVEMGVAGWTVQLYWKGSLVTSTTTDESGYFQFPNLGDSSDWAVCLVSQAGYLRTQPASGNACDGAGYAFTLISSVQTMYPAVFGVMLQ